MRNKTLGILVLCVVTVWLYGFTLKYGFFQDDFYTLVQSQAHNINNILRWLIPGNEIYYRPISMRIYFWLMNAIFGLNPFAYHVFALILHLLNSLLVVKIATKLSHRSIGWITGFLYATSSIHFIPMMWIAEIGLTMGITMYLLATYAYLSHRHSWATLLFILGLFVHEYLITLPIIFLLLDWYQFHRLKLRWSLMTIATLYLVLRVIIFPVTATGSYSLTLGKSTFWAAFWYGIWSLNIPENIKDQLQPGFKLNQTFLYDFLPLSLTSVITLIIIIILFAAIPLAVYIQTPVAKRRMINRHIVFCIGWIMITLSIPLVTPLHLYPMYASLALFGIGYGIAHQIYFAYKRPQIIAILVVSGWVITAWQSTRFMEKIHWTAQEAIRVEQTYQKLTAAYGQFPRYSTIVINQDYQIQQALYDELGLKVLFQDPTLKTHYGPLNDTIEPNTYLLPGN